MGGSVAAKTLDVQARLEFARAGVAVLRALRITDRTMQYGEFARAVGLIADGEAWQPWHRQQVSELLRIIAAVERQARTATGSAPLEFERIVNSKGEPGAGVGGTSRIVTD